MALISWDEAALSLFFVELDERLLPPLAAEVADVARELAPVRGHHSTPRQRESLRRRGVGGNLKASVQWNVDRDLQGAYADIAALWYGRFLDPPARQLHRLIPFLPTALERVIDGRTIHLD